MSKGFVYIMSTLSMPHIIKIGCSIHPEIRRHELSKGSVPYEFQILKIWESDEMRVLESLIHKHLDFCRVSSNREFFSINPKKAIKIIDSIIKHGVYNLIEVKPPTELKKQIL